ncbi:MAG: hypothetical protein V4443_05665 [Pseudomonadota bacterium]
MPNENTLPGLSRQVSDLVLAGSIEHAEQAFSEAADKFGDLAVAEVFEHIEPQVASLYLTAFDGGKLSMATLLVPPRAWAQSLAFFAAPWTDDEIEDEPELLAEALFAHIHGIVFSSDDIERSHELLAEALATDWGTTAFAVLFSMAPDDTMEVADEIHSRGVAQSGQTSGDDDVIPLAVELAKISQEGWERVLLEIFPEWRPGEEMLADTAHGEDEEEDEQRFGQRSTQELLRRLRSQVPSVRSAGQADGRRSMGEDIFQ